MTQTHQLSEDLKKIYEGMTLPQLHAAIICDNTRSQQALWYLLDVRLRGMLEIKYRELCPTDTAEESRTFDDYLTDFFLYLYEGMPGGTSGASHFYYLTTVSDNTKLSSWMQRTFRYFLEHERRALSNLEKALPEYVQEQKFLAKPDSKIDMARIAYSIAWLNQYETPLNRYIFFRGISHQVLEDFSRTATPDDRQIAEILGLSYGNYRTKSSRLCEKVRTLIRSISRKEIRLLDANSLALVDDICGNRLLLTDIVSGLLDRAEAQLPEYESIMEMRMSKDMPICIDSIISDDRCLEISFPEPCGAPSMVFDDTDTSTFASDGFAPQRTTDRKGSRRKRNNQTSFVQRFLDYIFS